MPTISQLPSATTAASADEVPISQGGVSRAISVGALLASTQPAIIVNSAALLGRTSLGPGSPEQIDLGVGVSLAAGTLIADGLDHSGFPILTSFSTEADLVISHQGSPMLMQASLLRGLFTAGGNITIDLNGTISATASSTGDATAVPESSIAELELITSLASQDLIAVSHEGSDYAIAYDNLLGGVTIGQAVAAAPTNATDTVWVGQGSDVMVRQTFSAVWQWITSQLLGYRAPTLEITADTTLDMAAHNGRTLVCGAQVTISPNISAMGSGFQCVIINASGSNITFGTGFISSSGSPLLGAWQSATISCVSYSGGTIAFAAVQGAPSDTAIPGQPTSLSISSTSSTSIGVSWLGPTVGGTVASYVVQIRQTGTTIWTDSPPVVNATIYQITSLQPSTSYDISVAAQNASGTGPSSSIVTVSTAGPAQSSIPSQVSGITATATSSNTVLVGWSPQTGAGAATSFIVQYRVSGSANWTYSVAGLTGTSTSISGLQAETSFDFCVTGANAAGVGPASASVTAVTPAASGTVTSITWNLIPSGPYTHGSGTIGVNAQVVPAASPIQFGFSTSATTQPAGWTAASLVNGSLWGAYVPSPAVAGTYYVWAEGLDGSTPTVCPSAFVVQ